MMRPARPTPSRRLSVRWRRTTWSGPRHWKRGPHSSDSALRLATGPKWRISEGRRPMTAGDVATTRPPGGARSRAEFGSDYIVELLRALNIEYTAFNPGSSFRGIHDSLVNFEPGNAPEVIE